MTGTTDRATRTLLILIGLGIANHSVLAGSRVVVSLDALSRGASPLTVGSLISLYALIPSLCSVMTGRLSDRLGVRPPMIVGSVVIAIGATLPFAFPGMPALFGAAALVGMGFMAFQLAAQNATGELGGPAQRTRNFNLLSLGYSTSGFIGPLVAGFTIDHFGYRVAFGVFALVPFVALAVLVRGRLQLPGRHPHAGGANHGGVLALLRHKTLRRVFAINALMSLSWDLHTLFVPIYGERIGLSASQIGLLLASFAAATFVVRFSMRAIARRFTEQQVLTLAMFVAGAVYVVFPFSTSFSQLMLLSFVLGFGLGSGQPMVMSLLHMHTPPGRIGEAVGVRMTLVNSLAFAMPLVLGGLGASIGIGPVFWSAGACLLSGGFLSRRSGRH